MAKMDLKGRRVLDIGTRDGKFAFAAEKKGAIVTGIDRDQSICALWLKDHWKSTVTFQRKSLYRLPATTSTWEIVFLFGVLYHLRYPMRGLRIVTGLL